MKRDYVDEDTILTECRRLFIIVVWLMDCLRFESHRLQYFRWTFYFKEARNGPLKQTNLQPTSVQGSAP